MSDVYSGPMHILCKIVLPNELPNVLRSLFSHVHTALKDALQGGGC